MAVKLQNTIDIGSAGLKCLVYGAAGVGKTRLCATLPSPIILSAEAGLLSLAGQAIPYITVDSVAALAEAYDWLIGSAEADPFQSVCLDSVSEIAEVILGEEKRTAKDPRQAYGALNDIMGSWVRKFRDLPGRNVYFSAKQDRVQDDQQKMLYGPGMPGVKTGLALPYAFDIVAALRMETYEDGTVNRALMCQPDGLWQAKDRSGCLDAWEVPDLGAIIKKIGKGRK